MIALRRFAPLVALALGAAPLSAQRLDSLTLGARVRAETREPFLRVTGTVVGVDTASIVVRSHADGRRYDVRLRRGTLVHVSLGSDSPRRGFRRGALAGAVVGLLPAVAMVVLHRSRMRDPAGCEPDCDSTGRVVAVGLGFTAATTVVGGAVGAVVARGERSHEIYPAR